MSNESDSNTELDNVIAGYLAATDRGEIVDRERLKADHPNCARELQSFFDDLDETLMHSGSEPPRSRTIGNYKLLQRIGVGGMGEVWMAEQEKPIRRRVAVKLIKAGMDSKPIVARFEAERQALAMMDHQSIAKVLDAGTTFEGRPYFVMELVQGMPITRYCDLNKLSVADRLRLFMPVCKAVQHAHQKGIIHRDIKPSNILVTLYDGQPVPKVIDFGLAKALQHQTQLTDKTFFTEFGQVVGTLQYMSPEQAEMNALDIDTRTDIYALGVVLYELLTGSTPIDRQTLENQALLKVLQSIREMDPPKPSVRLSASGDQITGISQQRQIDPRKLTLILQGDLDWIVMKALEKDRTRRYDTADGFAEDLSRFLRDEAVEARPPSTSYRIQKFVRKNRRSVLAASAILTLLLVGIVVTSWLAIVARIARDQARDSAVQLVEQTRKTAEAQRKASEERSNLRIAEAKAATAQYFVHIENARREIAERRPQWRSRSVSELKLAANTSSTLDHDAQVQLKSLAAAASLEWDISAPKFTWKIKGVQQLAFHPNKPWLFAATDRAFFPDTKCHIFVFDVNSGKQIADLSVFQFLAPARNGVRSLAFGEGGTRLYAGLKTGGIAVFNLTDIVADGASPRFIEGPQLGYTSVCAFDSLGILCAVGTAKGGDRTLLSYDLKSNRLLKETVIPLHSHVAPIAEKGAVMLATGVPRAPIIDVQSHMTIQSPPLPINADFVASYSGNIAVREDERLLMTRLDQADIIAEFERPSGNLPSRVSSGKMAFSRDGFLLAQTNWETKETYFWSSIDHLYQFKLRALATSENDSNFDFSPDGMHIAVTQGEEVTLHELLAPALATTALYPGLVRAVAVDEGSEALVVLAGSHPEYGRNQRVGHLITEPIRWKAKDQGANRLETKVEGIPIACPELVAISKSFVAVSSDFGLKGGDSNLRGNFRIFDRSNLAQTVTVFPCDAPDAICFRADEELIVSSKTKVYGIRPGSDQSTRVWQAPDDYLTKGNRRYLTISEVQEKLVLTDKDGYITVLSWNGEPTILSYFPVSTGPIRAVSYFASTGKFIVGDDDGQLAIVKLDNKTVKRFPGAHRSGISSLAWITSDSFASGGSDRVIRIWSVANDDQIELKCEIPFRTSPRRMFRGPDERSLVLLREGCQALELLNVDDFVGTSL